MALNLPDPNIAPGDPGHASDTNLIIEAINTLKGQVDNIPAGPQGAQGEPGTPGAAGVAATITVASTVTTSPGADAAVTESGTPQNKALTFYIPRGQTGPQGEQGPQGPIGPQGPAGESASLYDSPAENLGTAAAGASVYASRGDHVHNMPTAADVGAAPASGIDPTAISGTAVVDNDVRLSDPRVPLAHAVTHGLGESDAITIDPSQVSGTAVVDSDVRLSDPRVPLAHAVSHGSGQSDEITIAQSQVTDLVTDLGNKLDESVWTAEKAATLEPMGIVTASALTLAFNEGTRVVTVTPTSGSYDYYFAGNKVTVSTPKTVTLDDTDGLWFVYFSDGNGTLVKSQTPWDLGNSVPVMAIYYDATNNRGVVLEERHGVVMDWATHLRLHSVDGTKVVSGFALSNYTLNTDTNAAITPDVATGVLADEDLRTTLSTLTAGTGVYKVWYRDGASGVWRWEAADVPFTNAAAGYIHYNQLTGGSWTRTPLSANRWVNYYVIGIPTVESLSPGFQFAFVMSQTEHTSLANASAENVVSLAWGDLPFTELAALWKLTFATNNSNTTTGKVQLAAATRIVGSTTNITATGVNTHSGLSGLSDPDAHPATSIDTDTTNFNGVLTAADDTVQKALDTLDDVVIPDTLVNAKGDLIVATADNTVTRLGVSGNNGYVLTEDSGQASGVKWAAAAAPVDDPYPTVMFLGGM